MSLSRCVYVHTLPQFGYHIMYNGVMYNGVYADGALVCTMIEVTPSIVCTGQC